MGPHQIHWAFTGNRLVGIRVKAEGGGYNGVYRARKTEKGWAFLEKCGTALTPGIGYPMYYPSEQELFDAVTATCEATIKRLPDRPLDPYGQNW